MSTTNHLTAESIQHNTFRFADGQFEQDRESTYFYTDDYFRHPATVLDPHLRTMSCVFCLACFPSTEARNYERVYRNAESLLQEIGFSDLSVNADYKKEPARDTLGALVAHKIIRDGEEEVSLVVVGLRGANYGDEWVANLVMGKEGPAEGFQQGMLAVKAFLDGYLEQMQGRLAQKIKFWITGFSRVAATANLLGAWIGRHAEAYRTSAESIYVYTFETPTVASKEDRQSYPFIHNTINTHDLVTFMAPVSWGFQRYGADDTCLPNMESEAFRESIDAVRERARALNPDLEYDPLAFVPVFLSKRGIVRVNEPAAAGKLPRAIAWLHTAKMDEFLERFMDFMSRQIVHPEDGPEPSDADRRNRYCSDYQSAFAELAASYLGPTEEVRGQMRTAIVDLVTKDISLLRKLWILMHFWHSTERSFRKIEQYLITAMEKRMRTKTALGMGQEELEAFFGAIEKVIYYFIKCASIDLRRHHFSYLPSLFLNLATFKFAHMPEVIFAWLQEMDSYYT